MTYIREHLEIRVPSMVRFIAQGVDFGIEDQREIPWQRE